ncbi:MAG TPA: DMT family transporter [Micromonosporaceae bacterium]|nr:DMT family transporter [Micromonosporaceae bacterium]
MPGQPRVHVATVAALTVAVLAISSSAPLIAYAAAPGLAIAFWRNAASSVLLAPVAGTRRRHELAELVRPAGRGVLVGCVLAGAALAVHFGTWIPSAKLTSVADSVALGATQPVWQGLIARWQGRHLSRTTWVAIGMAVAGAVAATGADIAVSPRAVAGDLLALAGGVAIAVYTALGERVRATVSTVSYTTICYTVCAVLLGLACLIFRVRLAGYPATTWLAIAGMVVGAQFLGHSMFNYALHRVAATTIAVLILLEVPGAALVAWLWLGQAPAPGSWPGLVLLTAGVAVVVVAGRRNAPLADPEVVAAA